jgi:hypothetical protein
MVRGIEKRRIVDDEMDRRNFVRRLGSSAEETRTSIYAWALMSNHVHILLCSGALGFTCGIAGMGMFFRTGTNRLSATAIAISPSWCATFT